MDNNILKIIFRVVAVLLSLGALFFQLINFVFGTMVKNVSDMQDDYWYYEAIYILMLGYLLFEELCEN